MQMAMNYILRKQMEETFKETQFKENNPLFGADKLKQIL